MVANHNGEMSGDGWLPMNVNINGQLHPTGADYADWYARAARGYDSWVEMTAATGLPLAQNTLLMREIQALSRRLPCIRPA